MGSFPLFFFFHNFEGAQEAPLGAFPFRTFKNLSDRYS
jgi:hypothetical protein